MKRLLTLALYYMEVYYFCCFLIGESLLEYVMLPLGLLMRPNWPKLVNLAWKTSALQVCLILG